MDTDQFISELKEKFYNKNTFFKRASDCEQSVLNTIKSYMLKKNLVLISKAEYEQLKTRI
jgi:hypothetical protein